MPASRPPQGDFSGGPPSFRQFFLSILGALPCQAPIPVLYGKQSSERETVTRNITFLGLTLLLLTPLALSAGDEEGLPEGQARTGVATVTHVKDRVDVKQIVETINTKTSFKARAPEEKIFSFTDGPMEFFDPPALITPVRAPEEEKFSFADWLNPTSES